MLLCVLEYFVWHQVHKVAEGALNATAGRLQESRPRACGTTEVASGMGSRVASLLHFYCFLTKITHLKW